VRNFQAAPLLPAWARSPWLPGVRVKKPERQLPICFPLPDKAVYGKTSSFRYPCAAPSSSALFYIIAHCMGHLAGGGDYGKADNSNCRGAARRALGTASPATTKLSALVPAYCPPLQAGRQQVATTRSVAHCMGHLAGGGDPPCGLMKCWRQNWQPLQNYP